MFRKIMRVVLSKTFAFALLALLQIGLYFFLYESFAKAGTIAYTVITVISVVVLIAIFEQDELNPAYKLMWVLIIVVMPVSGTLFYLLWGHRHVPQRKVALLAESDRRASRAMRQDRTVIRALQQADKRLYHQALYLINYAYSPVCASRGAEYYPLGEDFFPRFLECIQGAKKFIFMEYYIYEEGTMLNTTIEILRQKAAEGVDVRILYDGFGSLFTLPANFAKRMRSYGIKCYAFCPLEFTLHISDYAMLNHRDHRKITVVDGEIAFSGGLNFADEYINVKERFGEWKDTAYLVRGEAAYSHTITFLRNWDFVTGVRSNYEEYAPALPPPPAPSFEEGLVQPYWDSPLDGENISENAYLNIIRHAEDYVYISTPYLILDNEMITALTLAAKSGIDVRILTPGIPDKKAVFLVTQSYYPPLLKAGVRIFEYTPGFNHAKMYVSDDKVAIVGSANMDYRSLYLHFENCACFYGGHMVPDIKNDMVDCFAHSSEITLDAAENVGLGKRLVQIGARFFAPML